MNLLRTATATGSRRSKTQSSGRSHKLFGKSRTRIGKPRSYHGRRELREAKQLIGRDLVNDAPRRRIPIWLIPGIVVGGVFAALAIAHVRVELIGQGYKRYSAVERLQALEEEKRILTAHVRKLRDPARLAGLAREMNLSRPDQVITLAPPGDGLRP